MWVLETIINIITFLKVKLVFHRYNKMVRCSSCISMGNSFIKEKINLPWDKDVSRIIL